VPRSSTHERRASLLADAIAIIEVEYADDLSLDELAHRIATSRRQLQRAFNELAGTTFRDYLSAIRFEHAIEMLEDGVPITDVAQRLGYAHPWHFARAFRRHFGVVPSQHARRRRPLESGRADAALDG
jgi:AraC-like DNA-binding protein